MLNSELTLDRLLALLGGVIDVITAAITTISVAISVAVTITITLTVAVSVGVVIAGLAHLDVVDEDGQVLDLALIGHVL